MVIQNSRLFDGLLITPNRKPCAMNSITENNFFQLTTNIYKFASNLQTLLCRMKRNIPSVENKKDPLLKKI